MKNLSLKNRIILSIVALLTLTSAFFGTGMLVLQQKLEEATFGKMVREQMEAAASRPPQFHISQSIRASISVAPLLS